MTTTYNGRLRDGDVKSVHRSRGQDAFEIGTASGNFVRLRQVGICCSKMLWAFNVECERTDWRTWSAAARRRLSNLAGSVA